MNEKMSSDLDGMEVSPEKMAMIDEMSAETREEMTVSLPTPEGLKDAKAGESVTLQGEIIENKNGLMTVNIKNVS